MIYGLIIAAGNQTRFKSEVPKALVTINNECLLDINVRNMNCYCDKVFVVCSVDNEKYFIENNYEKIIIESGYGGGDAVLKALYIINPVPLIDTCFIQWGDSLQDKSIYPLLIHNYSGTFLIPCIKEQNPYVQVIQDGNRVKINFSKYNEHITPGYHDLSIFYGDANFLLFKLLEFKQMIYKEGKFHHKHGNEMEFLDVFNETNLPATILEVDFTSRSFNTLEELESIITDVSKLR